MDKRITKSNVISVPAVPAATEYFSPTYNTKALHKGEAFLYVADGTKIGTNITMNLYGSVDGTTWFLQGKSATIANGAGVKLGNAVAHFAPYFRVGVVFTGSPASGHGVKVDVVLAEKNLESKRAYGQVAVDGTSTSTDTITITCPGSTGKFEKVYIYGYLASAPGSFTNATYTIETSLDGSTWYVVDTVTAGTSLPNKVYEDIGLLKYVRFVPTAITGTTPVVNVSLYGIGY